MNCKRWLLLGSATAFLFFALTAEATEPSAGVAAQSRPEEITITGRKSRWVLEAQIRQAEENVYNTFNKLNDDHQYDVHCHWEVRYFSHVREHVCRPAFLDTATAAEAKEMLTGTPAALPVAVEATRRYPVLKEKMEEVVKKSPEMRKAMLERYELQKTLDEMNGKAVTEQAPAK